MNLMGHKLEIIDCQQNTPEWLQARVGVITASGFKHVMAKSAGKAGTAAESKTRQKYLRQKAYEQITGKMAESFSNAHTERGHVLEPEAIDAYSFMTDADVSRVGFMKRGPIGCSPDLLVGDAGMAQVKTLLPELMLELLEDGEIPSEHRAQMQGEMLVATRFWSDFIGYCPGLPLFVKRMERDEAYIASLEVGLETFLADLAEYRASIETRYLQRAA